MVGRSLMKGGGGGPCEWVGSWRGAGLELGEVGRELEGVEGGILVEGGRAGAWWRAVGRELEEGDRVGAW